MNSVRIVTEQGQVFDYYNLEDLNIRLNRVIDDYNDIETRFSEYSYQFSLPKTNNNNLIFQHANAEDLINKFERNSFNVTVFLNSSVLFKGILSLLAIEESNYRCVLLSKVSELVDDLGELELREITTLPDIDWDYENTIRTHVNANYQSSDQTYYQFPLVYYSTFFAPPDVLAGQVDFMGYAFNPDRMVQNYYYILNKTNADNQVYFHQMPMALYLIPVLEAVLKQVGWSISGSFFEREDIKRIIIPYVGDNDIYDDSVYCTNNGVVLTGGTCDVGTLMLRTANFLPEMTCVDFINAVINTFNLYFSIDLNNKIISFETYNTLFTNRNNPYVLDNKIDFSSVNYEAIPNPDPTITFESADSNVFFGDNTYYVTGSTNARTQRYKRHNEEINIYNYIGTSDEQVDVGFGEPIVARKFLRNKANYNNSVTDGVDSIIFLPQLTRQTLKNNQNNPFYKRDTDTVVNNTEETIKHDGLPTLLYYLGQSDCDFEQQVGKGSASDWFYINFHGTKMKIPFSSPYAYTSSRTRINQVLNQEDDINKRAYASAMQSTYLMMGSGYTHSHDFSLILSEQGDVYPTLYNAFHEEKFRRYRESYVLVATIRLNIQDWNALQMHVPIMYNKQIYSLLSIEDYDCLNDMARIKMIRV
jgi:hypothetical protein